MSVVRRSRLRISVYCQDYVWDHDYAIAFAVPICESGRLDTKTEQPMDPFLILRDYSIETQRLVPKRWIVLLDEVTADTCEETSRPVAA